MPIKTPGATALQERWVMIVWNLRFGVVCNSLGLEFDPGELPLTPALIERLRQWPLRFVRAPETPGGLATIANLPGFAAEGLSLARAVKEALPDWTIIYSDEYLQTGRRRGKLPYGSPYDFEILPNNRVRNWHGLAHAPGKPQPHLKPDPSFEAERWVKIMCDHGAYGVWHRDGSSDGPEELPISQDLIDRIKKWQALFEELWDSDDGATPVADITDFCIKGRSIARDVKQALPDWIVVYFDEGIWEARRLGTTDGSVPCEYEILLSAE